MLDIELLEDVHALLRERIDSVEQLTTLVLLWERPEHTWTAESVGHVLGISSSIAAQSLDHLCRGNLLDVRVGNDALVFRYSPATPELGDTIERLMRSYASARADVLKVLSANAARRGHSHAERMLVDELSVGRSKKD